MPTARPLAFEREIKKVSTVADAVRAPMQLSLDERLPRQEHGWEAIIPHDYGYTVHCKCGWYSREVAEKRSAHHELRAHIARTPQGTAVLNTLRRVGRSGNGA